MASETPAHASGDAQTGSGRPPSKPGSGSGDGSKRVVRVGKYEVVKHIANGGMGVIYRARDVETGQEVALKILKPETAANRAMLVRFQREFRSAKKLEHENIVQVYDFGEVGGAWYFAMEFVDGIDLHDYTKRKGTLDPEESRQIVLQAARALQHAYEHGIVHRDIKPSNFLLTRKPGRLVVKLTDFGLAREMTADEFRVTRAGTTVGTVDYMSPEQARDSSAADIRSDLYSLGSTWYHLLTGHSPFPEGGLGERLIKIMTEPPTDAREINPRISDDTWAILERLLAKDPDDRYQTPQELIEALVGLEGNATARPRPAAHGKKKPRKSRPDDTRADAPATVVEKKRSNLPYILGTVAALIVVGGIIAALALPKHSTPADNDHASRPPPVVQPGPGEGGPDPDKRQLDVGKRPGDTDKTQKKPVKEEVEVKQPRWPALYKPSAKIDVKALRQEVEKPWADRSLGTREAFIARVSRSGAPYHSLNEAVAAAPEGRAIIVEIHDNGPLFESTLAVEGRALTIRAGKGYRPLLIWDVPATLEQRRREKPEDRTKELVFLDVRKGSLHLEGLEMALRWPDSLAEAGTILAVSEGELDVDATTVSAAGKPRDGITLARFRSTKDPARCRFTRTFCRGASLTALDLDAPHGDVLFDGCLVVGGQPALLRLKSAAQKGPRLRLVGSTLVCARNFLEVKSASEVDKTPVLNVLAWDSLLSRFSGSDGALLELRDGGDPANVQWRAVNALYAGWKNLLSGATRIEGDRARQWRTQWKRTEGDESLSSTWPEGVTAEPAGLPAQTFLPDRTVGFASSVDPEKPLGCDLGRLTACRDNWLAEALDPVLTPIDVPADSAAPDIPSPGDEKYHGERIDLESTDLGAHLARKLESMKPGPRIVLHLTGKGDHSSSPIRLKGASLVLFFEEPEEKKPRTALKLSTSDGGRSLIEVEDGSVEVIAGVLKLADESRSRGAHLVRVKGGDVKLYRTRLEGPQQASAVGWRSAISLAGSGDPSADKVHTCALNECVIVSNKAGVVLDGTGCRLGIKQSLVVAGTEAVQVRPGADCKGRTNIQCTIQQSTLAGRQAIVRLGDAASVGPPADPVMITTRDCAFLNPFPGQKAGLIVYEGSALPRGLLLWQGEREGHDQRLFFAARAADAPLPQQREGLAVWRRMWGSTGAKQPRPEVGFLMAFEPKRWPLERLIIRMREAPGADLEKLGVSRKR
jgi:serine/threonine protein kinase